MKAIKHALTEFLAGCVEFDGLGYSEPKENTLQCAAYTLYKECIERVPSRNSLGKQFTGALQGLPSYINAPFMNWEIVNLMYALGMDFDRTNESEQHAAIELYWTLCGTILKEAAHEYLKTVRV
jgi:hypothetical protein